MLTTEARERLERGLSFSPERSRVTVRRDDLRESLGTLDSAVEALMKAVAALSVEEAAPVELSPRPPPPPPPTSVEDDDGFPSWSAVLATLLMIFAAAGGYLLHG